jgi:putative endonuclease
VAAKDGVGKYGERVALRHLEDAGFEILARNWRCPDGEIDIVALDGDALVIAEVKTRKSLAYGHPFEAVGAEKLGRLHRLASAWCRAQGLRTPAPCRVDVVAVLDDGIGEPAVEHLKGVG